MVVDKIGGRISLHECEEVIRYMYNEQVTSKYPQDSDHLIHKLNSMEFITKQSEVHLTRVDQKETRQLIEQQRKQIEYKIFEKIIIEFLIV